MKLEKKLSEWKREGVLDDAAVGRIEAYEAQHARGARWVVWALAAVGALAVVTGIISLIAANWDEIPDALKLATGLWLLLGTVYGAYRSSDWIRDLFLLVHQGLVIAMIGLVAQVYHLSGHPWRPFGVAFVFAIPAALAGRRAILADVVLAYGMLAGNFWLDEHDQLSLLWRHYRMPELLVGIAGALIAVRRVASSSPWGPALARWAFGLGYMAIATAAIGWGNDSWSRSLSSWTYGQWPLFAMIGGLALAGITSLKKTHSIAVLATVLIGSLFVISATVVPDWTELALKATGFVLFSATAVAFTFAAASLGSRFGTNVGSFAIALRIIILFFELFENLTDTGIGLIASGLLLVGIAYAWWRVRVLIPVKP